MWEVSRKIDALWSAVDKSICKCPVCGTETSDMTFNPYDMTWYCPKCYSKNQTFYKKRGKPHFYP
jgi:rubredoxin